MNAIALPNGLTIQDASRHGAEHVYDEIFVRKVYHLHGIEINDGDVIVDAGANVGVFPLWLIQNWMNVTVHLFEPVKSTYDAMFRNVMYAKGSYGCFANNRALGSFDGVVEFLTCPRLSQWSGRRSWTAEYGDQNVQHVFEGMDRSWAGGLTKRLPGWLRRFVARRILNWHQMRQVEMCQQTTWSTYADRYKVNRVDLFKVDVEGAELDVLKGIADHHWPGIRQFVVKSHSHRLAVACEAMLKSRGYKIVTDKNVIADDGLPIIYARRQQQ